MKKPDNAMLLDPGLVDRQRVGMSRNVFSRGCNIMPISKFLSIVLKVSRHQLVLLLCLMFGGSAIEQLMSSRESDRA